MSCYDSVFVCVLGLLVVVVCMMVVWLGKDVLVCGCCVNLFLYVVYVVGCYLVVVV